MLFEFEMCSVPNNVRMSYIEEIISVLHNPRLEEVPVGVKLRKSLVCVTSEIRWQGSRS